MEAGGTVQWKSAVDAELHYDQLWMTPWSSAQSVVIDRTSMLLGPACSLLKRACFWGMHGFFPVAILGTADVEV